jgi:hypothetical protein
MRPALLDAVGLGALAGLAAFCLSLGEFQPLLYKGGFAAVGLTTAALIAVVAHPQARVGTQLLGWRPLRWVGERSYGIYLWHWPVFMVTRPGLDVPLEGAKLLALRLAVTVLLAHLSYRYVEQPIRHGALGRAWRTLRRADAPRRRDLGLRWVAFATPVLALCVVVGVAVWRAEAPAPPAYLATHEIHTAKEPAPAEENAARNAPPPEAKNLQNAQTPPAPNKAPARGEEKSGAAASDAPGKQAPQNGRDEGGTGEAAKGDGAAATGPVSAIGDSVMLGSAGPFQKQVDVSVMDAEVGMQVPYAIDVLRSRGPPGSSGIPSSSIWEQRGVHARAVRGDDAGTRGRGPRDLRQRAGRPRLGDAQQQGHSRGVARHPNAELVDWYSASAGRPELFVSDGVHLQPPGQRLYAAMIREQVEAG